jgi:hypothetical protein
MEGMRMNLARRDVLRLAALTGAGLAVPGNAFSRTWPERPARAEAMLDNAMLKDIVSKKW